jgi:two-component system nitrogen regulation response regulator NtrX
MAADILIVDDEADIRGLVAGILEDEGYGARLARDSDEAIAAVEARRPQLILLDIWLQGSKLDGLQLLEAIKRQHPNVPVVMISGHGNIETAVRAIKLGASERALETSRLKREVNDLRARGGSADRMVGSSSAISNLRRIIEKLGPANSRVLISGAAGSGKELAARLIHENSARANGPFVVINAPTMSPERMEAELFGVESGVEGQARVGALEEAHGGTLYLDEIADMPRETQAKILRVLVDQNFQRVGGASRVSVDVRIISSTSRDLAEAITEGRFREDLFHRLSVVPVRVPSLAERREDIPELVQYFSKSTAASMGVPPRRVGSDAMAVLESHDWPGNIRQLRNNVERLMILALGDPNAEISASMLPAEVGALVPAVPSGIGGEKLLSLPLREAREAFERDYLVAQISRFGGNISRTAEFIGMERSALHRKLKSLGVE